MTSPLPASDDGSASMVFDDDQSEAEKEQLLGKGREAGRGGEHEAESDEASVPSQVLEDEDSNCSSMGAAGATASNQTKALQQLDHLQDCILDSVRVASEAIRHLSTPETLDEESVQKAYDSYLEIMQEIHEGLASRASWIKHYVPYNRHTGDLRQEVRVLEMRLGWLKAEAKRLGYPEGGWKESGGEGEAGGGMEKEDAEGR
ncbi:Hypothetical protein NocV09_00204440 [Nannochloropsis oceanica]